MKISLVPKEEVIHVWGTVEKLLERAVAYSNGRFDTVDLYMDILKGDQTLWIAFDEDRKIHAAATMRVVQYPGMKVLRIESLAGGKMAEWVADAHTTASRYGKESGCSRIEAFGRKGWQRVFAKFGGKPFAVQYELEI